MNIEILEITAMIVERRRAQGRASDARVTTGGTGRDGHLTPGTATSADVTIAKTIEIMNTDIENLDITKTWFVLSFL